jgi:DNA-binding CsgD family transcriptional regulator
MQPAARAQLLTLRLAVHGLTPRERQVTELCVAGYSTREVSTMLGVSIYTIRGYLVGWLFSWINRPADVDYVLGSP